jgi:hypothetical protein
MEANMADGDHGRPEGRVLGMEEYRAAKLRTLETVVMALVHRQEDPAWLRTMITETEALPVDGPDWVGLWRASQLQFLNKALYGERQILADDDVLPDGEGPAQGDLWDQDPGVLLEVDAIVDDARNGGEPVDFNRLADATEHELARHLIAQHLDPPDPAFWRAVIAELRSRADQAAAA